MAITPSRDSVLLQKTMAVGNPVPSLATQGMELNLTSIEDLECCLFQQEGPLNPYLGNQGCGGDPMTPTSRIQIGLRSRNIRSITLKEAILALSRRTGLSRVVKDDPK